MSSGDGVEKRTEEAAAVRRPRVALGVACWKAWFPVRDRTATRAEDAMESFMMLDFGCCYWIGLLFMVRYGC